MMLALKPSFNLLYVEKKDPHTYSLKYIND